MSWPALLALSLGLGLAQMLAGPAVALPPPGARTELLLLLAFYAALQTPAASAPALFWWCGLAEDVFLGSRLGPSALLYPLASLGLEPLRTRLAAHALDRLGWLLVALVAIQILRPLFAADGWRLFAVPEALLAAGAGVLWTLLLSPLAGALCSRPAS